MKYDFFYTEKLLAILDAAFVEFNDPQEQSELSDWKNAAELTREEIARLKAELSELRAKVASNETH